MTFHTRPIIRTLSAHESEALLAGNWIGRMAFSHRDQVDIEPIHYIYKGPFSQQSSPFAGWDYDRALAALRRLDPNALMPDDPMPQRNIVFGLVVSEMTGRRCVASHAAQPAGAAVG